MTALAWWFRTVGIVYVALGATFLPFINSRRVTLLVPAFDAPEGGAAWRGFVDYLLMFGLEELVLGAFLIAASFVPAWFTPLVLLACALSAVRGIGHDVYMITQGYSLVTNLAFIALHAAIIATGLVLLRRAATSTRRATPGVAGTSEPRFGPREGEPA